MASSSTKSKASSLDTQSTCETWGKGEVEGEEEVELVEELVEEEVVEEELKEEVHLVPELHSVELAGVLEELGPEGGGDELGAVGQLVDHVGHRLRERGEIFLCHNCHEQLSQCDDHTMGKSEKSAILKEILQAGLPPHW